MILVKVCEGGDGTVQLPGRSCWIEVACFGSLNLLNLLSLTYICKIEPAKCQDEDGDVAHEFLVEDEEAAFAGPVFVDEVGISPSCMIQLLILR